MKHIKLFIFLCTLTFAVSCGQQKTYIQYKVKEGETMSKIAQKLNMKTNTLKRLNPDIVQEPSPNSFLVVPFKKLEDFNNNVKTTPEVVSDSISAPIIDEKERILEELKEQYLIYEVKKGDTFYRLNKNFNVTRGELLLLNPELAEGLKVGSILKIKELVRENEAEEGYYHDFIDPNRVLKVALLLPFKSYKYQADTLTLKEIFSKDAALLNIATDFYLGAEMAVDSLRRQGVSIELNTFDTGDRRSNQIVSILSDNNFNTSDVIIGPLYSQELKTVAQNVSAPVIFPVYSKNQSEFNYSNVVKTSPEKNVFREELQRYIQYNFEEGNIIIVGDSSFESVQASNQLKSALASSSTTNISILTPLEGYIDKERFLEIITPNTNNWVVMATDDDVIVSDAINSLISLPEETTAKLFTYDRGNVYNKIDNRKLAKIGFTYVSDEFVDENSLATRVFTKQYVQKNNALPSFYATKGFDITYDILVRLSSGNDLQSTFNEGISMRVETKFDYTNSSFISENKGLFIVQYNEDLSLTRLK